MYFNIWMLLAIIMASWLLYAILAGNHMDVEEYNPYRYRYRYHPRYYYYPYYRRYARGYGYGYPWYWSPRRWWHRYHY